MESEEAMINRVFQNPPIPIGNEQNKINRTADPRIQSNPFRDILQEKLNTNKLSFSAHATQRMNQRNIDLDSSELQRLEEAVDKLASKGGKESLITMDNVAYVVNVTNRTVITAVDKPNENVFTNIDSAAFA